MESRRIVYYSGNTVKRSWSKQSVLKRLRLGRNSKMTEKYSIPKHHKVFATQNCMWCPSDFDRFRIVCQSCRSCQYCGMLTTDPNYCSQCANQAPPDIAIDRTPVRIKVI